MKLISVNVGKAQPIAAKSGMSGIFKQPTQEAVAVTALGLQGDAIVDTQNHGGVDQAVYIYTVEDYDWWAAELGRPLAPGIFGENLTLAGAESASWAVGDCFAIGSVILQVTSPRVPCVTLATRMGDPQFVKKFTRAGASRRLLPRAARGQPTRRRRGRLHSLRWRAHRRDGDVPLRHGAAQERRRAAALPARAHRHPRAGVL